MGREEAERTVLAELGANEEIADTWDWSQAAGLDHDAIMNACRSLEGDGFVVTKVKVAEILTVTEVGRDVLDHGSPEVKYASLVPDNSEEGVPRADVDASFDGDAAAAFGAAMKAKFLQFNGKTGILKRKAVGGGALVDATRELVSKVDRGEDVSAKDLKELIRRNFVSRSKRPSFSVSKGDSFALSRVKESADLTEEMLVSGSWREAKFKAYNFDAEGVPSDGGRLHTLLKVRAEFRRILLEMGFCEMPTARWVESSFWNFDALFQPQSHPARDAHDTFFIKSPEKSPLPEAEYMERVRTMHQTGGSGSIGYRYHWSAEEARRNILRTHTTAVSSRMLYAIASQPGGFKPAKLFSIDRVFRNEALDATHLAEFHQVEGVVADYGLSLGHLIGMIAEFFSRIGITKLRFKPAYNPYTEPSVEVFGKDPTHGWMEVGNAGCFRPEMLAPMGIPKDVTVIAWGLSLERPTMIKYGFKNIRDLFGHKVKMTMLRETPIVRF